MTSPTYITPESLAQLLRGQDPPIVVDVRQHDRAGGHIKNSLHIPADLLRANPDRYALQLNHASCIVVHCMFSQVRGPSCATLLASALSRSKLDPSAPMPQVVILEGGFAAFSHLARKNPDLFEHFDSTPHQYL